MRQVQYDNEERMIILSLQPKPYRSILNGNEEV